MKGIKSVSSMGATDMNASSPASQCGSMLLALLMVLSGVGAVWVVVGSSNVVQARSHLSIVQKQGQLLVDARQALISYATLYPFMYGPRGAGPGHLPCPDTDIYADNTAQTIQNRRDGPNPPCGSNLDSLGKLPRHVVLDSQRYMFHTNPTQDIEYQVINSFINNPTNRIVNSGMLSDSPSGLHHAAVVSLPPLQLGSGLIQLPLSTKALLSTVKPAVAAWFIQRLRESKTTPYFHRTDGVCDADFVVYLISDHSESNESGQGGGCVEIELKLKHSLIEGVPASRHWFVRNKWQEWLRVSVSPHCQINESCRWYYVPSHASLSFVESPGLQDVRAVHVRWMP